MSWSLFHSLLVNITTTFVKHSCPASGILCTLIPQTTVEIDNIDDLKKLFDDNKGKPFALNAGADVDVAFSADRLYVVKQNYDLFGGMTMDDVLKEIAPHLTSECVVSDLKKLLHLFKDAGV